MRRVALTGVLGIIAAASGIFAVGMLLNVWPGPGDNSTGFYLAVGLPALALCVAALVSLVGLWRGRETRDTGPRGKEPGA